MPARDFKKSGTAVVWRTSLIWPVASFLALLLLWQLAVTVFSVPSWLLPSPLQVLQALCQNLSLLLPATSVTLYEAFLGLVLATLIALLLAAVLAASEMLFKMVYPLLVASQTVPIIVLAPVFLIWFGYSLLPKIVTVVLVCFFPIIVNTMSGLQMMDGEQLAFFRQFGGSGRRLFFKVRLPAALPYFFSGLRIAATYSVMGAVIGEWLGAASGIGRLLTVAQRAFDMPLVFACIALISLTSALMFLLVYLLERCVLRSGFQEEKQNFTGI